jgi:hypothetical protein
VCCGRWIGRGEGDYRKQHNEELQDLYFSANIIRAIRERMKRAWHVARMGETRNAYRELVGEKRA